MIAIYIIIGIALGAVVIYLLMNQRMGALRVELGKKETEIEMMKTTKEQLRDMGVLLAEAQARHLNKENQESMDHITQPLKDAISEMRKAINDNTKDHTAQTASLKEQLRLMMETGREISEKAEGLANVLRRDNKISGNMGEIILGDLLSSQGLTEGIHYEVQARLRDEQGRPRVARCSPTSSSTIRRDRMSSSTQRCRSWPTSVTSMPRRPKRRNVPCRNTSAASVRTSPNWRVRTIRSISRLPARLSISSSCSYPSNRRSSWHWSMGAEPTG